MKSISVFFLLLLVLVCGSAAGYERDAYVELDLHESYMLGQKNVTLAGITDPSGALLVVDGKRKAVMQGSSDIIKGVHVYIDVVVEKKSFRNASVFLNLTTYFDCGNGVCEDNESAFTCCYDCNCSREYDCISNQCIMSSLNECLNVSVCEDDDNCTADSCSGIPRKCSNAEITWCSPGDNCCPSVCGANNDSDCAPPKECSVDSDCTDSDPCTGDLCDAFGKCSYLNISACIDGDGCCPSNCIGYDDSDCNETMVEDTEIIKNATTMGETILNETEEAVEINESEGIDEEPKTKVNYLILINAALVVIVISSVLYFRKHKS